jgi:hypothetical protein
LDDSPLDDEWEVDPLDDLLDDLLDFDPLDDE